MNKNLLKQNTILFAIFFFFNSSAFATEKGSMVLSERIFNLPQGRGSIQVITRTSSVSLGHPFRIEIKTMCQNKKTDWAKLPISDSETVCDLQPNSPHLTEDGKKISVIIKETDSEHFNEQSRLASPKELEKLKPICKSMSKEFSFSLDEYCH